MVEKEKSWKSNQTATLKVPFLPLDGCIISDSLNLHITSYCSQSQ